MTGEGISCHMSCINPFRYCPAVYGLKVRMCPCSTDRQRNGFRLPSFREPLQILSGCVCLVSCGFCHCIGKERMPLLIVPFLSGGRPLVYRHVTRSEPWGSPRRNFEHSPPRQPASQVHGANFIPRSVLLMEQETNLPTPSFRPEQIRCICLRYAGNPKNAVPKAIK